MFLLVSSVKVVQSVSNFRYKILLPAFVIFKSSKYQFNDLPVFQGSSHIFKLAVLEIFSDIVQVLSKTLFKYIDNEVQILVTFILYQVFVSKVELLKIIFHDASLKLEAQNEIFHALINKFHHQYSHATVFVAITFNQLTFFRFTHVSIIKSHVQKLNEELSFTIK